MLSQASRAEQALIGLGFTPLESAVYRCLVEHAPITGYRVAQEIGKPIANTYKAIEALSAKGALLIDEGEHRLCRAVPPDELLQGLERTFSTKRAEAQSALSRLQRQEADERIYALGTIDQVYERARCMLASCKQFALLDLFPGPMQALQHDLSAAAARGVVVRALAYRPIEVPGVRLTMAPATTEFDAWLGQWLTIVVDGREHLRAIVDWNNTSVHHAVWSESVFLSCMMHDDLICQCFTKEVERHFKQRDSIDDVRASFDSFRPIFTRQTPGYHELARRHQRTPDTETPS